MATATAKFFGLSFETSKTLLICVICQLAIFITHSCAEENNPSTYDELYNAGVDAYIENRWFECASRMTNSLAQYRDYRRNLAHCRLTCKRLHARNLDEIEGKHLDVVFFAGLVRNSDCVRRCKLQLLKGHPLEVHKDVSAAFSTFEPYNFLQLCLHKLGDNQKAASAAFTYFIQNPKHDAMAKNLQQYRNMPEVQDSDFVNMEGYKHQDLYIKGSRDYDNENWWDVIDKMEQALSSFMKELETCEVLCEETSNPNAVPDFTLAVADHYSAVLKCKQKCPSKLTMLHGKYISDYIPDHYNYLQYSYYKVNDLSNAAACVASYLLFKPKDENQLHNKQVFLSQGLAVNDFIPRDEAERLYTRHSEEAIILKYLETQYTYSESNTYKPLNIEPKVADIDDPVEVTLSYLNHHFTIDDPKGAEGPPMSSSSEKKVITTTTRDKLLLYQHRMNTFEHRGFKSSKDFFTDGDNRIVVEGVLATDKCRQLMDITQKGGLLVFGRDDIPVKVKDIISSGVELIKVLNLQRATKLASIDKLKWEATYQYVEMLELVRNYLQTYFNISQDLYYQDVRLICRQVESDVVAPKRVKEKSCAMQEDGTCWTDDTKQSEIRAVLFLNDDFGGDGRFYFTDSDSQKVAPSCGKMVAYLGDSRHTLGLINTGRRCAAVISLTTDTNERDLSLIVARHYLTGALARGNIVENVDENVDENRMARFLKDGVKVVLNETDLNGTERFGADGVLSNEECETLVDLAKVAGVINHGYLAKQGGLKSPHTSYEKFVALDIKRAVKNEASAGDGYLSPLLGDRAAAISPHTSHEIFQGLTVDDASELVKKGVVGISNVALYLNASEKAKDIVENYFNLKRPLYFDFTHLVCRTALDGTKINREDMSHPIHSDNCIIQDDNSCRKVLPAYIQRDYSALLYLNGNFDGGEFIFADGDLSTKALVKPKCGRLVGFNAGTYHGVKAVLKGQRCAIALWFTLDSYYKEQAHSVAREAIYTLSRSHSESQNLDHDASTDDVTRLQDEL